MAGKKTVFVSGGNRKSIQTGGPTSSPGTTIAELGSTTVSLAQLKVLLGITAPAAGSSGSGGGGSTASILAGAGLLGGGSVIGAVPLYLAQSTPPVIWNDALLPDDFVGGAASGSGGGGGGSSTLAGLTDVSISSPGAGQLLAYNGTKWANSGGSQGGAGSGQVLIAEQIVTTAVTSITFSNIPQNFRNLRLVVTATANTTGAPQTQLTFNGDTGANYTTGFGYTGTGGSGSNNLNNGNSILFNSSNGTTEPGYMDLILYDYARTFFFKSISGTWCRYDSTSAGYAGYVSGTWHNTAAVTSLTLTLSTNQWVAGSVFTLYGEGGSAIGGAGTTYLINGNLDPDIHPATPTAWDDEFEVGSVIDTTGARFAGANAWTAVTSSGTMSGPVGQGALNSVTATASTSAGSGFEQALPASGAWEFTWKGRAPAFQVYNNSTWKGYYFGTSGSGNNFLIQSETRNWSTGSYAFNSSVSSFSTNGSSAYFKLKFDGTNLIFSWCQTGLAEDFAVLATVAASSWIVTATNIGFGTSPNVGVDWIRRTDSGTLPAPLVAPINVTPDTHPSGPSAWDDEFEVGTVLDTTGARRSGAASWVTLPVSGFGSAPTVNAVAGGALQLGSGSSGVQASTMIGQAFSITGPFQFTAKMANSGSYAASPAPGTFQQWGLQLYNSTSGKWIGIHFLSGRTSLEVARWTGGSFSNAPTSFSIPDLPWIYLQAGYDGTNVYFGYSFTGVPGTFATVYTDALSDWFAGTLPNGVGFHTGENSAGLVMGIADWIRRTL